MKFKKFYEEGGVIKECGIFVAKDHKDARSKIKPLNEKYAGWRNYTFEEIKEVVERPLIKRTVAV